MVDESLVEELGRFEFFAGLAPEYVRFLAANAKKRNFVGQHVIHRQGDPATSFYVVSKGHVSIEVPAIQGPTLFLQHLGPSDLLGWSWLFPPYRWQFDALAIDPVRAIAIDGKCLREKCEKDHHLGYDLMKRFSRIMTLRLQAARLQLLDLYGDFA